MTRLLARFRTRRAVLDEQAAADATAWLAPILADPAPAMRPRAGAHPYRPKDTPVAGGGFTAADGSRS